LGSEPSAESIESKYHIIVEQQQDDSIRYFIRLKSVVKKTDVDTSEGQTLMSDFGSGASLNSEPE
jgi:hypothetical protein